MTGSANKNFGRNRTRLRAAATVLPREHRSFGSGACRRWAGHAAATAVPGLRAGCPFEGVGGADAGPGRPDLGVAPSAVGGHRRVRPGGGLAGRRCRVDDRVGHRAVWGVDVDGSAVGEGGDGSCGATCPVGEPGLGGDVARQGGAAGGGGVTRDRGGDPLGGRSLDREAGSGSRRVAQGDGGGFGPFGRPRVRAPDAAFQRSPADDVGGFHS